MDNTAIHILQCFAKEYTIVRVVLVAQSPVLMRSTHLMHPNFDIQQQLIVYAEAALKFYTHESVVGTLEYKQILLTEKIN